MATAVAVLAVLVFGAGALMVRVGLWKALAELWRTPRRK
jgi:uncharacterized membrane protein YiaA